MKKSIIIKIASSLLVIVVFIFSFAIKRNIIINEEEKTYERFLSNNQFSTNLSGPSDTHQIDDFFTMSDLYDEIKTRMDSVAAGTIAQKEAKDTDIVSYIDNNVLPKKISISDANELFMFSNTQSINFDQAGGTNTFIFRETIEKVLSLDYVLLADIDYSTMKANKFIPIGTDIYIEQGDETEEVNEKFAFTGTFDGKGFEIKNLYLAEFPYISTTFQDDGESTAITVSTINNYAMFSVIGEGATVKNFILRNPAYELIVMDDTAGIFDFSYLAGENNGTIYNVSVIDKKTNLQGADTSGIIFTMFYPTTILATAASFVHTNGEDGVIKNSYFVGENIIVNQSLYRFSEVAPFVHTNDGTIVDVAFEDIAIVKPANFNPESIDSFTEAELKNGTGGLSINGNVGDSQKWNFYPVDGYPQLIGLTYSNGAYQINNDYDLMTFSKLINLQTLGEDNIGFDSHTYVLNKDINMENFINYTTPSREFKGILRGGTTDFTIGGTTNNNKYIYNLNISNPYIIGNKYYLGLFSVLSGTVQNINFYDNEIKITSSSNDYGKIFHVGQVAGELKNGTIKNIVSKATVDLGTDPIGVTYAGGIAGLVSGTIEFVANVGNVDGKVHSFNNRAVSAQFYIGGIAGTNSGNITIAYSQNKGKVTAVGKDSGSYSVVEAANTFTGGIIGEVNNLTSTTSKLIYLSNFGEVDANTYIGDSNKAHQYVGGIFGSVKGFGFKLNDNTQVRNGGFENSGLINGGYQNSNTYLYAAGIGTANTTEVLAKISYLSNSEGYEISGMNFQSHNTNIYYAATVIDNSSGGIELSRAYNYQNYQFSSTYFTSITGLLDPTEIKIAPFFTSITDNSSKLLYVENKGNLKIGQEGSDITVVSLLKVSNITQATKIDYKNVTNSGDISVIRINNTNDGIFVAGIAWILPYISRVYTMNNIVNEGNIYTADIKGNTVIASASGMNYTDPTFLGTFSSINNLYVAGIVNLNVGEILNSFNLGEITSNYNSTIKDIDGTANSYVGGIVTFNYNLIKDAANSGNIVYTNSNSTSKSNFAGVINNGGSSSPVGGIIINYEGGLTIGGISAALGNIYATILDGYKVGFTTSSGNNIDLDPIRYAEIIDTINSGDIYGKSKEFVRSGGVLGIALSTELAAGTWENKNSGTITNGPFGRGIIGTDDPIGNSLLSNGLNYGNVYAISQSVGELTGTIGTGGYRGHANYVRPGVNSAAGGVVAYGLTKMIRMINHGTITSTDVAGGVIGATYILGVNSGNLTTTININTAVHYGKIKVAKKENYSIFTYNENETFSAGKLFYGDNNEVMFPIYNFSGNDLAYYPNEKRGFGGFIGRLQRGVRGAMSSENFENIMNMDPNVDLIGRTDMNSVSVSRSFYRLHSNNRDISYYSARENDTTGYVVVGWYYSRTYNFDFNNSDVSFTIQRTGSSGSYQFHVTKIVSHVANDVVEKQVLTKSVINTAGFRTSKTINRRIYVTGDIFANSSTNTQYRIDRFGISNANINTGLETQTIRLTSHTFSMSQTYSATTSGSSSTPPSNDLYKYSVEHVVDDENSRIGKYIFDQNFPLMSAENTEFIYPVKEDSLADRFSSTGENPKPNGMYVLASSTGSLDGAALPTNININNFWKLKEDDFAYIDLENPAMDDKVLTGDFYINLLEKYQDMYQLKYNNKSEVLAETGDPTIADLVLYDPTGNSPILTRGVINYSNNTITYTLSDTAFRDSGNSQIDTVNYKVKSNTLSNNAVIAKDNIAYGDLGYFRNDYLNRVDGILQAGSDYEFAIDNKTFSNNIIEFDLKVYSEISLMDQNIFDQGLYTTTYTIRIVRSTTTISTNATITLDDSTTIPANPITENHSVVEGSINPDGKIEVSFTGINDNVNGLIPLNHMMSVHKVYLVENGVDIEIDSQFYNVTIVPKGSNNEFGFIVEFNEQLKNGNYKIEYRYYDHTPIRTITVTKSASNSYDVIELDYEYLSNDEEGFELEYQRVSGNFTTYTEFGYIIDGVTSSNQTVTIEENDLNTSGFSYIHNFEYDLFINSNYFMTIKLAPFATLKSAQIKYEYITDGRLQYVFEYEITNSLNSTTYITHEILERHVSDISIYVDDNLQTSNSFRISREASLSKIAVDFNFIDSDLNNKIELTVEELGNPFTFDDSLIYEGNHSNMFIFYITGLLDRDTKSYLLEIDREGAIYSLPVIEIEKEIGTSAYLLDIKFTLDDNEVVFEYPAITTTDSQGDPTTGHGPRVYSDGIDYGSAMDADIKYFRIDGKVSDIILEDYSPRFYLPYGATIERYTANGYSPILTDDFTGSEDDQETIVLYKVTSEDGLDVVYYRITVIDIKYNLTIKLKIYWDLGNELVEASENNSMVKDKFILIALKNLKLDTIYQTTSNDVAGFPEIGEENILGINNQASLFYYAGGDGSIVYRFGRNSTGSYNFDVIPPVHSGSKTSSLTPGERYKYEMYMVPAGFTPEQWRNLNYKLPAMSSIATGYSGVYYHVFSNSIYPITRELAIVIVPETNDVKWGLYDDYSSWD